jgi:hypothetical protein
MAERSQIFYKRMYLCVYIDVNQTSNDRIPEIAEINALLDYNDIRIKPIVLSMRSSGIRVGACDYLQWKHVIPIEKDLNYDSASIIYRTVNVHIKRPTNTDQWIEA